jgi:putative phosphotransacetylase
MGSNGIISGGRIMEVKVVKQIPVGVSGRHVHLSREHLDILFGKGYELTVFKGLSQPNQYASNEKVDVISPEGKSLEQVRILGPIRKQTQVEISNSDAIRNKFVAPVRSSGDLKGSGGAKIIGPKGQITIEEGVIIADRHIHFSTAQAKELKIKDKQLVSIQIYGEKLGILQKVLCRVDDNFELDCHLDTDDGSAFNLKNSDKVGLIID